MSQHGCPERLSNRSKGFQEDGPSQPTMEVLVETLTGTAFEMTVSPSDTIFAIKSKIFRVEGIPISQQHLLYNLKELDDSSSLREHSISDGARLRLVLGMRGGPISTRRLPPPARDHTEPWPDIERLLDSNREDGEWSGSSGCKVTVLVFRDGERVNMLRVRENHDGTYSPLDTTKYSSSLSHLVEHSEGPAGAGSLQENAVTQGKMMEIRRRMETLSLQRHTDTSRPGEKPEIQKTRIEKTLSVPSLLDDLEPFKRNYSHTYESADTFAPLYDGNYTRYDYDCTFTDRFSLPPLISPIGTRSSNNEQTDDDLKLSDTLAGSILVKREDGAILEECIDSDECRLRQDSRPLAAKALAPIPTAEYGPLVGGVAWSPPAPPPAPPARVPRAPHSHSASSLQLRAPPPAPDQPPLSDALFSSSTSELEKLKRNSSRILPALSRHRNRSHLHLSDEGLHLTAPDRAELSTRLLSHATDRLRCSEYREGGGEKPAPAAGAGKKRVRCALCCKRLSIATVHTCRCGARYCAPHRYAEVHGCAYDYKANAHLHLQRVQAPKLPEI